MKTIEVTAAIALHNDEIYCTQRGYGEFKGYYEFPGGKIEKGESSREALHREIEEELDCPIKILSFFRTVEYDYPDFHLKMDCWFCRFLKEPHLLEHLDGRFVQQKDLKELNWLPADEELIGQLAAMDLTGIEREAER